jgi:hypothetical protein
MMVDDGPLSIYVLCRRTKDFSSQFLYRKATIILEKNIASFGNLRYLSRERSLKGVGNGKVQGL